MPHLLPVLATYTLGRSWLEKEDAPANPTLPISSSEADSALPLSATMADFLPDDSARAPSSSWLVWLMPQIRRSLCGGSLVFLSWSGALSNRTVSAGAYEPSVVSAAKLCPAPATGGAPFDVPSECLGCWFFIHPSLMQASALVRRHNFALKCAYCKYCYTRSGSAEPSMSRVRLPRTADQGCSAAAHPCHYANRVH
ncbi:hypothetical protein B0J12DRAFT_448600 [Macrophomina phaseolina]|uniref:Uncharacterized protein n=1 Tax=Macrophomina phaseolina TaxID=35725 RepID=A0ABQ8GF47_9PEZI|nr:hypothetical protein B0J12DRAFT_448600 [Macrophomina phaseolina]